MKEKILHAAVKSKDGWVFIGKCHADCFHKMRNINIEASPKAIDQGFVTSEGRFVDRKEGAFLARCCGQVNERVNILFSEDMWHPKHNGIHTYCEIKGYQENEK